MDFSRLWEGFYRFHNFLYNVYTRYGMLTSDGQETVRNHAWGTLRSYWEGTRAEREPNALRTCGECVVEGEVNVLNVRQMHGEGNRY